MVGCRREESRDPGTQSSHPQALTHGYNVVVDDTNLVPKHERDIRKLVLDSQIADITIETKFFDVSLEECVRDAQREGSAKVGEGVIRRMAAQLEENRGPVIVKYEPTPGSPICIVSDLDGTLALHEGVRNVYDGSRCHLDRVNEPVADILCRYSSDITIVYMSGRDDTWRPQTLQFLEANGLPFHGHLYMRDAKDKRKDNIVKQELFDQHVRGNFNVLFVLDDRDAVVKLWRDVGLTCLQVNYGAF